MEPRAEIKYLGWATDSSGSDIKSWKSWNHAKKFCNSFSGYNILISFQTWFRVKIKTIKTFLKSLTNILTWNHGLAYEVCTATQPVCLKAYNSISVQSLSALVPHPLSQLLCMRWVEFGSAISRTERETSREMEWRTWDIFGSHYTPRSVIQAVAEILLHTDDTVQQKHGGCPPVSCLYQM